MLNPAFVVNSLLLKLLFIFPIDYYFLVVIPNSRCLTSRCFLCRFGFLLYYILYLILFIKWNRLSAIVPSFLQFRNIQRLLISTWWPSSYISSRMRLFGCFGSCINFILLLRLLKFWRWEWKFNIIFSLQSLWFFFKLNFLCNLDAFLYVI